MNFRKTTVFCCLLALVPALPVVWGQPPAPLPFGSHMMLQCSKPNQIRGRSLPGDRVRVEIAGHSSATAGPDGRWRAQIQPPEPNGPCTVKLAGFQTVERK